MPKSALGNTWWGFDDSLLNDEQRKALLLWLNGTLSILSYFGRRAITEGAWMQMKKPAWASMPVLDVRALTATQVKELAAAYDRLSIRELAPIAQLDNDPVRQEIDAALCKALGLPDLSAVRELLAREPGLTAEDIAPRKKAGDAGTKAAVEDEDADQLLLAGLDQPKVKAKRGRPKKSAASSERHTTDRRRRKAD